MSKKINNILKLFYKIAVVVLVLIIAVIVWLYSGTLTEAKIKVLNAVPLPITLVNLQPISAKDFFVRLEAAEQIQGSQVDKQSIIEQMVNEAEVSQIASARDVTVSHSQIDQEYSLLASQTSLNGSNFEQLLQSQGLNENLFKTEIIKPKLLFSQLKIWFNSQASLSPQAYQLANSLLGQINNGGDMAALAGKFSDDPTGKNSGGDAGFVQVTDLSPELRESVSNLKPGQAQIIAGLGGLFIIRQEGLSGNLVHLREIFLNTNDFNSWLTGQEEKSKVIYLTKI